MRPGSGISAINCSATLQYNGEPRFACTLPAGHKGPHCDFTAAIPMTWTSSIAAVQPRRV